MVDTTTMNNRKTNNEDEHSSEQQRQPSISDDTNGSNNPAAATAAEAKGVGRKRTIDESLLDPEELRKLESRRAYNRQCAAKGTLWYHVGGEIRCIVCTNPNAKRNLTHTHIISLFFLFL
jgi:hypothetical protein